MQQSSVGHGSILFIEYYSFMQSSGCVSPTYMDRQFDINEKMRAILVDWLIEVYSSDLVLFQTTLVDEGHVTWIVICRIGQLPGIEPNATSNRNSSSPSLIFGFQTLSSSI
jgi:hypothetical protein